MSIGNVGNSVEVLVPGAWCQSDEKNETTKVIRDTLFCSIPQTKYE